MAKINIANGIISSSADYGLYRGTSKIVNIQDGEFRVLGDLIAENYIVSSSVSNIEYQSLSGSTIFGDSADDTHVLSGSVTIKSPSGDALILDDNNNGANKLSWAYNGTSQYYMRRLHTDGEFYISSNGSGGAVNITGDSDHGNMPVHIGYRLGIGNTSPAYKLQVTEAESAASDFQTNLDLVRTWGAGSSTDRYHGLIFSDSNSVNAGIFANRLASHANYNSDLHFYTNSGSSNMTPATALSTSKMMITAAGNVGIGNTGPAAKLHVSSNSDSSEAFVIIEDTDTTAGSQIPQIEWRGNTTTFGFFRYTKDGAFFRSAAESNLMHVSGSGQVGIGTTAPERKLHVVGNPILIDNNQHYEGKDSGGTKRRVIGLDSSNNINIGSGQSGGSINFIEGDATHMSIDASGNVEFLTASTISGSATSTGSFGALHVPGRVGIGTTSQNSNLTIQTTANSLDVAAATGTLQFGSVSGTPTPSITGRQTAGTHGLFLMAMGIDGTTTGDMIFNTRENNNSTFATTTRAGFKFQHFSTDLVTILRNGKVGINTTSPEDKLTVQGGNIQVTGSGGIGIKFVGTADGSNKNALYFRTQGGTEKYRMIHDQSADGTDDIVFKAAANSITTLALKQDGKVGIGTSSPAFDLEIADNGNNSQTTMVVTGYNDQTGYRPEIQLRKSNSDTLGAVSATPDETQLGMIRFRGVDSGNGFDDGAIITATQNGGANTKVPTDLKFETSADTATNSNQLFLHHDGGVGIGTDSPGQGQSTPISDVKLDVLGNQMLSDLSTTNTDQAKLFFFRSDGAVASQGVVPDGLKIGAIEWAALTSGDNNNSISSARIEVEASSAWNSASVRNADITFSTVGANTLAERLRITSAGYVGIGTDSPSSTLTIKDTGDISTSTFISGITGDGFRILDDGADGVSMEIDNIMVRNTLRTHIFQKDTVKATNGILMVSDSGVISGSNGTDTVTFLNSKSATFADNTRLWYKDVREDDGTVISVQFDINGSGTDAGGSTTYSVDNIAGSLGDLTGSLGTSGGTAVRISGGSILLDASTPDSPFIDVLQSSGSGTANGTVMRMGNLDGITSPTLGSLSGFGIWASGSAYFEGKINATKGGFIAGWDLNEDTIEKVDSNGGVKIDSTNKRIDFLSDASTTRLRVGQVDSNKFGIRGFDSNADRVFEISETRNEIAGWDINPGNIVSDNSEGSVALSSTDQALTIWTGSINGAEPKLVVGKLPINDGTVQNPYGFAVFSGAGPVTSSANADSASVLITANKARLAGWELVPGRLKSGTVADINGNKASIALGTGATTATATPTDGLFFVSASAQPVFYVGSSFSYVNDTLTAAGWTIDTAAISKNDVKLDSTAGGEGLYVKKTSFSSTTAGGFLGLDSGTAKFNVGNASKFIKFDGTNFTVDAGNFSLDSSGNMTATSATLTGTVTATAGEIGGYTITDDKLESTVAVSSNITASGSIFSGTGDENVGYRFYGREDNAGFESRTISHLSMGSKLTQGINLFSPSGSSYVDPTYAANDIVDRSGTNNFVGTNINMDYRGQLVNTWERHDFGPLDTGDGIYETITIAVHSGSSTDPYNKNDRVNATGIHMGTGIATPTALDGSSYRNTLSILASDGTVSGSLSSTGSFGRYEIPDHSGLYFTHRGNPNSDASIRFSHDDDALSFNVLGTTPRLILDNSIRISLSNNDAGGTAGKDSTTGNTLFGYGAGGTIDANTINNTFIGHGSGDGSKSDAQGNTGLGTYSLNSLTAGDSNVAVGYLALEDLTSGVANVAVGQQAGGDLTTTGATHNVIVGTQALYRATTGAGYNVAIGSYAMGGNFTTANVDSCVAIGYEALNGTLTTDATGTVAVGQRAAKAITSGAGNTAIGFKALTSENDGDHNTAVGYEALTTQNASDGDGQNTAVGFRAGKAVTTGIHNTIIGNEAGDALTSGDRSVAIGSGALSSEDVGNRSIAIGFSALNQQNTSLPGTSGNIGIGVEAGFYNVTGTSNTFLGYQAGYGVSGNSHTANTAVGFEAGHDLSTGGSNSLLGYRAGDALTTGHNNVAIGIAAIGVSTNVGYAVAIGSEAMGTGNVTDAGDSSVAVGNKALYALTSGIGNVAVGGEALSAEDDGDHNTAIGHHALKVQTGTSGTVANTAVGYKALDGILTGGYNVAVGANALGAADGAETENVGIGYNAGINLNNGSNNIAIGSNTNFSTAAASNQVVIGKDATGVANNSVTLGNADTTAVYMAEDSGATVYAESISIDGNVFHEGDTDTKISFSEDQIDITVGNVKMLTLDESTSDVFVVNQDGADVNFRVESSGNSNMIKVDGGNDFVGIGKGSPSVALEVAGTISGSLINSSGDVAIGVVSPTARLHVKTDNLTQPVFFTQTPTTDAGIDYIANVMEYGDTAVNSGGCILHLDFSGDSTISTTHDFIRFSDGGGEVGRIHSEVSYGTFTGTHVSQRPSGSSYDDWKPGMIVKSTGNILATGSTMALAWPEVELTTTQKDKAVMGVWEANNPSGSHNDKYLDRTLPRINYNAVGEGRIRVTDTGGNIETGDYICSSTRTGHGEKQDDDLLHNYTVAKATQPYNFASASNDSDLGYKSVLIACTYHCG